MPERSLGDAAQTRRIVEQVIEATSDQFEPRDSGKGVKRAEWIAIAAFALNVATLVFGLGVIWADVQDHERRLKAQEGKLDALIPKVERIDANVAFLAERAREDRERRK